MEIINILSIETSCDETAIALVEARGGFVNPKFKVLKNIVSSQIAIHKEFGGVVPNLAKREHLKNLPLILEKLGGDKLKNQVDFIAVTVGPGLEIALWTGIEFAHALSKDWKKPIIPVSHLQGHLYSFLLENKKSKPVADLFPAIALIVSGGHTMLLKLDNLTKIKKLGETRDDAAGEAFDKAARLLRLPYPGGPEIEKIAKTGNSKAINFPRPMLYDKNYDFSFSGLKTSLLYYLKNSFNATWDEFNTNNPDIKPPKNAKDVAASFQQAIVDCLVLKTLKAVKETNAKSIMLSGGVAANSLLRNSFTKEAKKLKINFFAPSPEFNTDNAAMIAVAGYFNFLRKHKIKIEAKADLGL